MQYTLDKHFWYGWGLMSAPERLMSAWILSLEPEHRENRWATTEA